MNIFRNRRNTANADTKRVACLYDLCCLGVVVECFSVMKHHSLYMCVDNYFAQRLAQMACSEPAALYFSSGTVHGTQHPTVVSTLGEKTVIVLGSCHLSRP